MHGTAPTGDTILVDRSGHLALTIRKPLRLMELEVSECLVDAMSSILRATRRAQFALMKV